jgi:CubicO group peptidase (beta-lactamase class C family)
MRLLSFLLLLAPLAASQERFPGSAALDETIQEAIAADQLPGAVVLAGQGERILHRKAYGRRSLQPSIETMSLDTVFDAASLTKVVATTCSVMKLFEAGKIRLADPVTRYLPDFQGGKSDITVRHLLTHFSGLRPDVDLKPEWSGYDTGIHLALVDNPVAAPGERFIYSDINFILLGEVVHRVSGRMLNEFAEAEIFGPLRMKDTSFLPSAGKVPRIAPTERVAEGMLRGKVHDPSTRRMGGVAGHAGLFTTAADLARFARMILNDGELDGLRLFQPETVRLMTSVQSPDSVPARRGLGWDIDSPYSRPRGGLFPLGSFGHTGFTGTSIWMDLARDRHVVLLTNRVHPTRDNQAIKEFRPLIHDLVNEALDGEGGG